MQFILSNTIPSFKNKRGESITLNADAEVISLVIFENDKINEYSHLLIKHSTDGLTVNCMSFSDFQEMCRVLYTPIEIISYLNYRKSLYEKYGDMDVMIYDGIEDELIITKPKKKDALVYQFLSERYGYKESTKNRFLIKPFQTFLHQLPEHTVESSQKSGTYQIIIFLAHFDRTEITEFMKRLIATRDEAKAGIEGICKSLRRQDNEYAILFVAGSMLKMEYLIDFVRKKAEVKKILEVNVYWEDGEHFRIDFLYWYSDL